jgi:hypothetical protein
MKRKEMERKEKEEGRKKTTKKLIKLLAILKYSFCPANR